jgi:hypothetical protein
MAPDWIHAEVTGFDEPFCRRCSSFKTPEVRFTATHYHRPLSAEADATAIATLVVVRRFSFSLLCKIEDSWGSHARMVSVPHGAYYTALRRLCRCLPGRLVGDKLLP